VVFLAGGWKSQVGWEWIHWLERLSALVETPQFTNYLRKMDFTKKVIVLSGLLTLKTLKLKFQNGYTSQKKKVKYKNMQKKDKKFEEFCIGDYVTFQRSFSLKDFEIFSKISRDTNPLHHDFIYSKSSDFGTIIVPMHLAAAPLSAIAGTMIPGHKSLYLKTKFESILPMYYDREIMYSAKIIAKHEMKKTLVIRVIAIDEKDILLDAELLVKVRDDVPDSTIPEFELDYVNFGKTEERTVLITGSTGEIGREIAVSLAKKGFNLILHYNTNEKESLNVVKLCKSYNVKVKIVQGDLSQTNEIDDFINLICDYDLRNSTIDIVHAACPSIDSGLDSLMSINFVACKRIFDGLCKLMLARQAGSVTFIGSSALQFNPLGWENYVAAKVATTQYLSQISKYYENYGISARTVAPGFVLTDFSKNYRQFNQNTLLPEQIGGAIASGLLGEWEKGDKYIWIEHNFTKFGKFGFSEQRLNLKEDEPNKIYRASENKNQDFREKNNLDALLRNFFNIDENIDLSELGIDLYPGWDSLKHIELMIFIESSFSISFKSSEIENTTSYSSLKDLVYSKLN
jgi:3-oxoacyl-[acyl-carrier protein] reductase